MEAVSANQLTCFELEQGDTKLSMKREIINCIPENAGTSNLSGSITISDTQSDTDKLVTSPLVGTFYSAPSPDAEEFVKVGDTVTKGQTIGIVEAMKLMNEIECEYDGIVEAILVKNEETVEYGQPLLRIRQTNP